jgi:hypothetical protein
MDGKIILKLMSKYYGLIVSFRGLFIWLRKGNSVGIFMKRIIDLQVPKRH